MLSQEKNSKQIEYLLSLNLYVLGTDDKEIHIDNVMGRVISFFDKYGITIDIQSSKVVGYSKYKEIILESNPEKLPFIKGSKLNTLNLYFFEGLAFQNVVGNVHQLGGLSLASPAYYGGLSGLNSIFVNTAKFKKLCRFNGKSFVADYSRIISTTIVHEIGHFLGVRHTTEFNGKEFDLLPDTEECSVLINDTNGDKVVDRKECNFDKNVMFWQVDQCANDLVYTDDQLDIIKISPFMKVKYIQ